jgi:hypothetical protein
MRGLKIECAVSNAVIGGASFVLYAVTAHFPEGGKPLLPRLPCQKRHTVA